MNEKMRRGRFIVALFVFVGGFYLLLSSMMEGGKYFLTVDEAVAAPVTHRPVRIVGKVVKGSWERTQGSQRHFFQLEGQKERIKIAFTGSMPDTFTEGFEVTAEGKLSSEGVLDASEISAKCPSKYKGEPAEEIRHQATQP
ncbi:cytochrome c maturation protein CcmE [Myxococcota bacterium]|nr:cytochrome c maturation protein CcmE [Myxococcota bacterium]MBU1430482.1 cytochrome c maturation protein CcmE [Myxococcota bacterium]MBU1897521.1 cytochrome c maturation protein CcmE [Myxococcota bacterium]